MRGIDIHAHLMPHRILETLYRGECVTGHRNAKFQLVYGLGELTQPPTPESLTPEEKEAILWRNAENLLGL
jgi:hypothetical protein